MNVQTKPDTRTIHVVHGAFLTFYTSHGELRTIGHTHEKKKKKKQHSAFAQEENNKFVMK